MGKSSSRISREQGWLENMPSPCKTSASSNRTRRHLHDLILGQAAVDIRIHAVASTRGDVLDEAKAKGAASVLVTLELGNRGLGGLGGVETHNSGATGTAAGLVLNFGLLNFADGGKELDKVIIAGGPGQL